MNSQKENMNELEESGVINNVTDAAVEAQIAHHIADLLDNRARHLAPAVEQRLSTARSMAVGHLATLQAQAVSHGGVNQNGNVLQWFGHHRVTSVALIIGAMLIAIFAVQHFGLSRNIENSDAFLLASDLPPEAYADKGFDTWVSANEI